MGLKDLIKDVTDLAQDSIDSIQEEIALKKEQQQRLREEMNRRISVYTKEIITALTRTNQDSSLLDFDETVIVSFTKSFYEYFYLPANTTASSKLIFFPEHTDIIKKLEKYILDYSEKEQFLLQFKDEQGQSLILTTSNLHFKVVFPENPAFYSVGTLSKKELYTFELIESDQTLEFRINNYPLIKIPSTSLNHTDRLSLKTYLDYLKNRNFNINDLQIHDFILSKLNPSIIDIVKKNLNQDEILRYFGWGLDSMNSNKFLISTNQKIFLYDKEISTNKSYYYDQIISLTTHPSSISLLDLSLTIGINPNDLVIKMIDGTEDTISILYSDEAQHVVDIYNAYKNNLETQININQSDPTDPLILLEKLGELKSKGILTEEEFLAKKKELLAKI